MSGGNGGDDKNYSQEPRFEEDSAYFSGRVRMLFLAASLIMIVALPFLQRETFVSRFADIFIFVVFFCILLLGILGALGRQAMVIDGISSVVGFMFFEYAAVFNYQKSEPSEYSVVFFISQILAVIFFLALFYSIRTMRALRHEREEVS